MFGTVVSSSYRRIDLSIACIGLHLVWVWSCAGYKVQATRCKLGVGYEVPLAMAVARMVSTVCCTPYMSMSWYSPAGARPDLRVREKSRRWV